MSNFQNVAYKGTLSWDFRSGQHAYKYFWEGVSHPSLIVTFLEIFLREPWEQRFPQQQLLKHSSVVPKLRFKKLAIFDRTEIWKNIGRVHTQWNLPDCSSDYSLSYSTSVRIYKKRRKKTHPTSLISQFQRDQEVSVKAQNNIKLAQQARQIKETKIHKNWGSRLNVNLRKNPKIQTYKTENPHHIVVDNKGSEYFYLKMIPTAVFLVFF